MTRFCILVSALVNAFVTAFNLGIRSRGGDLTFYRAHVWWNQKDDCPMSGVGAHLQVDVLEHQC